jgi:hypothetical protein
MPNLLPRPPTIHSRITTARMAWLAAAAAASEPYCTSLGTVNLVAPIDRNFIDISAIIRFRLCTFEWPIEYCRNHI